MKTAEKKFLDLIKGEVSPKAFDLMIAFYALSETQQAFLMPFVKQIAEGANPGETIARAENEWHKLRMCKAE